MLNRWHWVDYANKAQKQTAQKWDRSLLEHDFVLKIYNSIVF